ncbi:hypothetical protein [Flavobacterium sp. CLA17]|uniref:hypothetical protein n=1 Tax=Flavobacterium sp. CLA17 TaxID=2724135 RepID=UPI0014912111|nr:hypothetical protein [Flavobacterium sp. CLA17]QSB25490.1 hypothetical protein HAV12_014025 [Flavobacterium sp. CLA17]
MTKIADQLNNGSISSGENVSFWIDSTSIIAFNTPNQNNDTEVLVIGIGKTAVPQHILPARSTTVVLPT